MTTLNIVLSILCLIISINCFMDIKIIENFFKEKQVKYATILGCFEKSDHFSLARYFMFKQERYSVLRMDETNLEESLNSHHIQIGVVLDGDCSSAQIILRESGHLKLFSVHHHWLILSSSKNMNLLKDVEMNINADIQMAVPNRLNYTHRTIFDIYNPASRHGGSLVCNYMGYYNYDVYVARREKSLYWLRKNLTGITFNSIIVLPVPFKGSLTDYLNSNKNKVVNTFNRFHNRLISYCKNYYNFTLHTTVSNSWGYKNPDNTFNGLVGALERKLIDFGSSPLFVRVDRGKVIDYGRNTWILRAAFIFRNPKTKTSFQVFLKPFSTGIWISTIFLGCLTIVIFKIVVSYEEKRYQSRLDISWSNLVVRTVGAFCQQGFTTSPDLICGRIVMLFIFFLSVMIYQFYSASIVSQLLLKPSTVIKSIEEILKSNMDAGCEDILYNRDYFQYTTDKPSQQLYNKKILRKNNASNFLPPEKGVSLVKKGNYAFHVELATAYPIIEHTYDDKAICELREVQMYRTQPMHANYQKNSPFRDMIDTCLQRLAEHGVLYRERMFWHPRRPECIQSSKSIIFSVGLTYFYPALMALGIGILGSLFILLFEISANIRGRNLGTKKLETRRIVVYPYTE